MHYSVYFLGTAVGALFTEWFFSHTVTPHYLPHHLTQPCVLVLLNLILLANCIQYAIDVQQFWSTEKEWYVKYYSLFSSFVISYIVNEQWIKLSDMGVPVEFFVHGAITDIFGKTSLVPFKASEPMGQTGGDH